MYDVCNTNGISDQNCPFDGAPHVLSDAVAERILSQRCGDFFTESESIGLWEILIN